MNIKEKIFEFDKYNDNWNGYDAPAFSKSVIKNALNLEKYLFTRKDFIPDIFPTASDSLQIEYDYNGNYLEIEIKKDSYEVFTIIDGIESELSFSLDELYEVVNKTKLFYRNKIDNVCLFTGAFNPVTIAHKHLIYSAMKAGHFDYFIFAISNQKFLDRKQRRTGDYAYSEKERIEFILAMTYNMENVLIFGVEKKYTYNVLCAVKEKYKCKNLYFALGSDKLQEIGRWGHHDLLLKEYCFYILQRKDSLAYIEKMCKQLFSETKYIIDKYDPKYGDISATKVRYNIKNNIDYRNLVDKNVYFLLKRNRH